jgi:membrane protease YdiL (CAAX protease family)
MAAALLAVFPEGRRRLGAFRKRKASGDAGRGTKREALLLVFLSAAAIALCIFGNAQIQAMGLNPDSVSAMQPVYNEISFPFLLLLFAGFTPFAEEFVFRGLVYTGLRRRFPPLLSVFLSAFCFGLYHGELIQGTYAFCMGLILGLSMEHSGNIRMPWLLHGLANGLPLCFSCYGLWEPLAGPAGRVCALVCLLLFAGLYGAFSARGGERK